ncbi:hypothetical protein [Paraburkholderia caffeinilytica]|uniref:hypothetical protein n=1 Tax=Paraburkholderia caffeinilytica TaxID=1761016 RepID=UPI003DA096A9
MRTSYGLSRYRNSHRLGEILFGLSQSTHSQSATDQTKILLQQRGYIPEHGRHRAKEFSKDFLSALSGGFEDERLNVWIHSAGMLPQALRSLRLPERPAHPVAIALLQLALESVEYSPPLTAHKQDRSPGNKTSTLRPGKDRLEEKKRLWLVHLSNHKDCTRNQARLLAAALWSWLYAHDPAWLEQHQRAPLPRTYRRPGIQATENIRARITASLRSSGDTKLLTRPRWRYRARINCGLPERVFDRLVTQRP